LGDFILGRHLFGHVTEVTGGANYALRISQAAILRASSAAIVSAWMAVGSAYADLLAITLNCAWPSNSWPSN
jgi:hypothetical protein